MQTWGAGVCAPWARAEKVALPFVHHRVGDRPLAGSRLRRRGSTWLRCDLQDWAGGGVGGRQSVNIRLTHSGCSRHPEDMAKPFYSTRKKVNADCGSQTAGVTTVVWALLMRWCWAVGTKIGKASGEKHSQRAGGKQVPADPCLLLTIAGSGGERLSECPGPGGPGSEGSLVVRGFLWETGRGLGRAGGVPGRDGRPPPPPRAGMMDRSRLSFPTTSAPLLLVLLCTSWPLGFLCYMDFSFTLFSIFLLVFLFSSVAFELQTSPGSSSPLWTLVLVGTCQHGDS